MSAVACTQRTVALEDLLQSVHQALQLRSGANPQLSPAKSTVAPHHRTVSSSRQIHADDIQNAIVDKLKEIPAQTYIITFPLNPLWFMSNNRTKRSGLADGGTATLPDRFAAHFCVLFWEMFIDGRLNTDLAENDAGGGGSSNSRSIEGATGAEKDATKASDRGESLAAACRRECVFVRPNSPLLLDKKAAPSSTTTEQPATRGGDVISASGIRSTKAQIASLLLPALHFSPAQLFRFTMKAEMSLQMAKQVAATAARKLADTPGDESSLLLKSQARKSPSRQQCLRCRNTFVTPLPIAAGPGAAAGIESTTIARLSLQAHKFNENLQGAGLNDLYIENRQKRLIQILDEVQEFAREGRQPPNAASDLNKLYRLCQADLDVFEYRFDGKKQLLDLCVQQKQLVASVMSKMDELGYWNPKVDQFGALCWLGIICCGIQLTANVVWNLYATG